VKYEEAFGVDAQMPPQNLLNTAQLEYKTPDVVIKVNPDRRDLIQVRELGGVRCVVINADEGIEINGVGATSQWNNDANWKAKGKIDDMPTGQVCCVFQYNSSNGKMDHTGLYVGGGRIIHCSGEVKTGKITDKGWTHYAVPVGLEGDVPVPTTKPTLRKGATGPYVVECQEDLLKLGYDLSPYGADGKYGDTTIREVKKFQTASGLTADGICGQMTWAAMDAAVKPDPTPKTDYYTVTIQHLTLYDVEALKARYDGAVTVRKED
jgi:hypothetical protein